MNLEWRKIEDCDSMTIQSWLSREDKKMLCMSKKSWQQTAHDIEDCLNYMPGAQFRNEIGYFNGKPVCAIMFSVDTNTKLLRVYNLLVRPSYRGVGIGRQAMKDVVSDENKFEISRDFDKIVGSVFQNNTYCLKMLSKVGLKYQCRDGDLLEMAMRTNEKTK